MMMVVAVVVVVVVVVGYADKRMPSMVAPCNKRMLRSEK
jgi:hypothetical protein